MFNAPGGVPDLSQLPTVSDAVSATDLTPVNSHVYVKPDEPMQKMGALYVPPSSTVQCTGTVIASDWEKCKPGDRIVYSRFWPFEFDGKTHVCCMGKDVVGVMPAELVRARSLEASGSIITSD